MENSHDYKINRYIFLAVIIVFALLLLFSLMEFLTAFLAGIMFYVLSKPLMTWLMKVKGWRKSRASILVIIISFFIILLPILVAGSMLYKEAALILAAPEMVIDPLKELNTKIYTRFNYQLLTPELIKDIQGYATKFVSLVLDSGFNFISTILMMYFFLYFMLMNINRMEAAVVLFLPFKRSKIEMFGDELVKQTFSNAVGIPLIALVHGLLAFSAYFITGLQQNGFWAVLTGFASVIPIVGTGLIWIPVSLFFLISGQTWQGLFVLGWGVIIIGTSDNVIRFLLAKKMADIHPIVTVLGVIFGLKYFGITGLIFGPLLISYFLILLRIYYVEYQKPAVQRRKSMLVKERTLFPSYFQIPFIKPQTKPKAKS
jgi:predicted PurR-regulated permease PerM